MSQYLPKNNKTVDFNTQRTLSGSFFVIPERLASIRAVVLAFTVNQQTNKQTLSIIYVRVASRNRTLARITVLRKWPIKFTERKSSFFRRPTSSYWWEIVAYSLLAKGRNAKKRKARVSKNRTRQ